MLGLTRRATESLKAMSKQLGAVVWQAVANKPIWVFLATAVISAPCLAETPVVNGAKVAPEFVRSGKVLGKHLDKSAVQSVPAKPSENGGVDSGAEGGGGSSETNFVTVAPSNVTANAEQNNTTNEVFEIHYLVPLLIALWIIFTSSNGGAMKTPNVELNGAPLAARPSDRRERF